MKVILLYLDLDICNSCPQRKIYHMQIKMICRSAIINYLSYNFLFDVYCTFIQIKLRKLYLYDAANRCHQAKGIISFGPDCNFRL